jgi:hypothetical protein
MAQSRLRLSSTVDRSEAQCWPGTSELSRPEAMREGMLLLLSQSMPARPLGEYAANLSEQAG